MDLFFLLLIVALLVSAIHMVAPDHWLPLTVIATARSYSSSRRYGAAAFIGLAHALTSIAIAAMVLLAGVVLTHRYFNYLILAGEILLVMIGVYFIFNGYREEKAEETGITEASALTVGAFPDFSLIPIVISAASLNLTQISEILGVFAVSSCLALVAMAYVAEKSVGKALSRVPPKYMDYVIGGVLIGTAAIIHFV